MHRDRPTRTRQPDPFGAPVSDSGWQHRGCMVAAWHYTGQCAARWADGNDLSPHAAGPAVVALVSRWNCA
jgi:hypothetical protein